MMPERRWAFSAEDVLYLEITCRSCGNVSTLPMPTSENFDWPEAAHGCPSCGDKDLPPDARLSIRQIVKHLFLAARSCAFRLRLVCQEREGDGERQ